MAKTIFKSALRTLVTGLIGSVLFWCPAWAQNGPTVTEALARAQGAGLPDSVIAQVMALAFDAGFDQAAAARTITVLAEAHQADFDLAPFRERIDEGVAKRVDGARIAAALEERQQRQMLVKERLPQRKDKGADYQAAVVSLADGLEMGLTPQEVEALVQRAGDAPAAMIAVAAEMWALLKQLDFDPQLTDQLMSTGFDRRTLAPAWRHFPQVIVIARRKGVSDAETGAEALKSLETGGAPKELLTRLGFTGRNLKTGPLKGN